ncbi:MAG: type II toxin-antitoxin system PrlF family antitoxin [Pseudomonadota bacterium]
MKGVGMPASSMTSKGQTTIPKKIREHLNLQPGDRVDFIIEEGGKVILAPATIDIGELEGILHRPGLKRVSAEDMMKAVRKRIASKVKR